MPVQPPFLVLREPPGWANRRISEAGWDTVVPIGELFAMIREVRGLLMAALSGDKQAMQAVETIHQLALTPGDPNRGRAIVSGYLIREQLEEVQRMREHMAGQKGPPIESPSESPGPVPPKPVPPIGVEREPAQGPGGVVFDRNGYPSDLMSSPNYDGGPR